MAIDLAAQLEELIRSKVHSGAYGSSADVVEDGLRPIEERESQRQRRLGELRRELAVGIEQADRRELLEGEKVFEEIEARLGTATGNEQ